MSARHPSSVHNRPADTLVLDSSPAMQEVARHIRLFSGTESTILITGETGTGKEVVARTIHAESPRAHGPFVAVNCAAIPGSLLEAELFGYERGAFTGAATRHPGRFEQANGGTLFLDEVGDMSLVLQAKLLRVLQEREVEHLGGSRPIPIDIRVLAATNRNLHEAIEAGTFREDLYYRLAGVAIHLPPLRERSALDRLVEHFLRHAAQEAGVPVPAISSGALDWIRSHPWPGNIRQLRSAIGYAVVMCGGETIQVHHLSAMCTSVSVPRDRGSASRTAEAEPLPTMEEAERDLIRRALARTGGNQTEAARCLGIGRNTIMRKMRQYGIR